MTHKAIVQEVEYPHPPERVWRALTDPKVLADWLIENDFEPRVGHQFRFRTKPQPGFDGLVECEVVEVDPPRRLAYTWKGGAMRVPTLVTFTLDPIPGGTRLRLEHSGWEGLSGLALRAIHSQGWKSKLLRQTLPTTLGAACRRGSIRHIHGPPASLISARGLRGRWMRAGSAAGRSTPSDRSDVRGRLA